MAVERNDTRLPGLEGSVWRRRRSGRRKLGRFLTSIALARTLSPSDYGGTVRWCAGLLSLNGIHKFARTSPLSVQGAVVDHATLGRYSRPSVCSPLRWPYLPVCCWWRPSPVWQKLAVDLAPPPGVVATSGDHAAQPHCADWAPASGLGNAVSYLGAGRLHLGGLPGRFHEPGTGVCDHGPDFRAAAWCRRSSRPWSRGVGRGLAAARGFWKFGSWILYGCFASMFSAQAFFWVWLHSMAPRRPLAASCDQRVGRVPPTDVRLGNLFGTGGGAGEGGRRIELGLAVRARVWGSVRFGSGACTFVSLLLWPRSSFRRCTDRLPHTRGSRGPCGCWWQPMRFLSRTGVGAFLSWRRRCEATFAGQTYGAGSSSAAGLPLAAAWGVVMAPAPAC